MVSLDCKSCISAIVFHMQLGRILLNPIDKDVNVRGLKIANTIQLEIVDSQSVGLSLPEISMRRDPYVTLKVTLKIRLGKSLLHPVPGIPTDFGLTKLLKGSLATNLKQART